MTRINSKNKGNNAERELAKIFSTAFDESFIRVPNSGAYVGGNNASRKSSLSATQVRASKGDIIPSDDMSRLVIECKHYSDINYAAIVAGQSVALLDKWLSELSFDLDTDDVGILCFRTNRKPWMIMLPMMYADYFQLSGHVVYGSWIITGLESFLSVNVNSLRKLCQ